MTKNNPARATSPHVSLIGHITKQELAKYLADVENFNGLANRILWACVKRSRLLPFGGECDLKRLTRLANDLAGAVEHAKALGAVTWAHSGRDLRQSEYTRLTEDRPGLWSAITSRAEAHVVRLALNYCLLDKGSEVMDRHVQSALALWSFCDRSAAHLFGKSTGDRDADAILAALRAKPDGMKRSKIRDEIFQRNRSSEDIGRALGLLSRYGLATRETVHASRRPAERWKATG
ncbi:MAG: hypothetical protein U0790_09380 [Isosphaeraceae bacterium]